jgi:four helix bundle protein
MKKCFDIYERTFVFSKNVVLYLRKIDAGRLWYPIIDQVLRSATSIGANVIEAKSGVSRRNLIYYYSVALRSANETGYWLRLIKDTTQCDKEELEALVREVMEISRILAKSILTMKTNDKIAEGKV